jgi:hypothetical protein
MLLIEVGGGACRLLQSVDNELLYYTALYFRKEERHILCRGKLIFYAKSEVSSPLSQMRTNHNPEQFGVS